MQCRLFPVTARVKRGGLPYLGRRAPGSSRKCIFPKRISENVYSKSVFSKSVFSKIEFSESVFSESVFYKSVFILSVFLRNVLDLRVF